MTLINQFDYFTAFSRNIGWLTQTEQAVLRGKHVAIAGMGGVGGVHLLTLTRLGIGAFTIADLDHFELGNFNRQAGAMMSTLGKAKVDILAAMARDINPEVDLRIFPEGVGEQNVDAFLQEVDLYVDGLDFFVLDARRLVYQRCAERGIPIIVAAPLGMGVGLVNYLPGGMPLNRYFGLEAGIPEQELIIRFMLGLSPALLQRTYVAEPGAVDMARHRVPSTPMSCELCAGAAATTALKILLNRGKVLAAPRAYQFDAFRNRMVRTWRPGGYKNPLQRLGAAIANRQLRAMKQEALAPNATSQPTTVNEKILDQARWAPSGDNTQVWHFEIPSADRVVVHGRFISDHCIYDLQGHASEMALGALLETMRIAATGFGLETEVHRRLDVSRDRPTFDVRFIARAEAKPDPLIPYIPIRSVQRRPLRTRRLTDTEKSTLAGSLDPGYQVVWLENFSARLGAARLMFRNASVRLTMPEAYEEHKKIIEWNARYSMDRIPDQALGVDPVLRRLMRWGLKSWTRIDFLNRYLAGTWLPRIEMDLLPGIACGAHFVITAQDPPQETDDYVRAGRQVQRFWLTATKLGLQLQPEITPLIFRSYIHRGIDFTKTGTVQEKARVLSRALDQLIGPSVADHAIFMGRIGAGQAARARSTRLPLHQLLIGNQVS